MGWSLMRFRSRNGAISWGCVRGEKFFPLSKTVDTMQALLKEDVPALARDALSSAGLELADLEILSPVTAPCQIICQGKNYREHMLETGVSSKDYNLLFSKADSSLAPATGVLKRPAGVRLLDYEVELGLVMGRAVEGPVTVKEPGPFVAGLVLANDVSARDVQVPERQWFRGKSFRGFCPVGPVFYFMETSDWESLYSLELQLKVNGEVRQKASTAQLMHKPPETLELISRTFDLRPGDLLLTGTPGGVSMRVAPKARWEEIADVFLSDKVKFARFVEEQEASGRYLRSGDLIEASIRGNGIDLGVQKLRVE